MGYNEAFLHRAKEKFSLEHAVDYFLNAERCAKLGRYDDAIIRLYRLCEYVAQLKIKEKELYKDEATDDLDIEKLPENLRTKYEKYRDERDKKVKLGLDLDYKLLQDLCDPLGIFYSKKREEFKKMEGIRNQSVLAHGLNPLDKSSYETVYGLVRQIIGKIKIDDSLFQKGRFPELKQERIKEWFFELPK